MQFRKTAISMSIITVLALVGCGGSSSSDGGSGGEDVIATQGTFIDAAVEGLYYVSQPSGKKGFTDAEGIYEFETGDSITFFLGGENGLRIGKTGARTVVSPFEATGNYQKAINLARILQTMGNTTADSITLPDSVIAPDAAMIAALNNVSLHDMDSADDLKAELGGDEWISEEDALAHLNNSLKDLERGSNEVLADWQRGSGKFLRTIESSLSAKNNINADERLYVHADKLLDPDIFDATRGMSNQTFRLDQTDLVILEGSNDSTVSEAYAALYLTCLDENGLDADFINPGDSHNGIAQCNGSDLGYISDKFRLTATFDYALLSPETESVEDEYAPWDDVKQFGPLYACMADKNCSENALTGFYVTEFNDDESEDQDSPDWRRDVLNTSYDSVSGVFTEVKNRTHTSGIYEGRMSQSLGFAYLVDSPTSERYVDFTGTWNVVMTRPGCDKVAGSTNVYNSSGVTISGKDFENGCNLVDFEETVTYAELAEKDFWWFATNGDDNLSKATLTQLNSTIRWCDIDENDGEVDFGGCQDEYGNSKVKFNRWEYAPSGADWDQGILNRRTLNSDGSVGTTISMYKI
ncbi:hypothetical protein L4D20_01015 [Vibrio kyushuensis]|uniref:hypothetical protein n=1 Tax=Vibrio kyushuensis TaxID=2910249 RepID=UPI003D120B1F